jgi:hypothetical protein
MDLVICWIENVNCELTHFNSVITKGHTFRNKSSRESVILAGFVDRETFVNLMFGIVMVGSVGKIS